MPRMKSKAVPGRYGPVPHDNYEYSRLIMENTFRKLQKNWTKASIYRQTTSTVKGSNIMREKTNQRQVKLQHEAQQPRLVTEADVKVEKKNRKRTKAAAAADRAKHWNSSSAKVDDGPTSLTSFDIIAELLLTAPEKRIGDTLVNEGAEAPKPRLQLMELRMLSSANGGLLSAGTASTIMRAIYPRSPPSWSICETEETGKHSSVTNRRIDLNQLAPPLLEEGHTNEIKLHSGV